MNQVNLEEFQNYLLLKRGYSAGSIETTSKTFRVIKRWFENNKKPLNQKSVEEYILFKKKAGYKNNTLNAHLLVLKLVSEYLDQPFMQDIKLFPKNRTIPDILTPEEIELLINTEWERGLFRGKSANQLNFTYSTLIMFLAYTGCRIEEATSLKINHVYSNGDVIFKETKNREGRKVFIVGELKERVEELIKDCDRYDYVFRTLTGNKMQPQIFNPELKERAKRAGIKKRVYPHLFRHSFISELLMQGVARIYVQRLAGHKDPKSTDYYAQIADPVLKRALYRHPSIRKHLDPKEILKDIISDTKEHIDRYKLNEDDRFDYTLSEKGDRLDFSVAINQQSPKQ